jgi:hypothetical protein
MMRDPHGRWPPYGRVKMAETTGSIARSPTQLETLRILEAQRQVLLANRGVIDEEIKSIERQIREEKRRGQFS